MWRREPSLSNTYDQCQHQCTKVSVFDWSEYAHMFSGRLEWWLHLRIITSSVHAIIYTVGSSPTEPRLYVDESEAGSASHVGESIGTRQCNSGSNSNRQHDWHLNIYLIICFRATKRNLPPDVHYKDLGELEKPRDFAKTSRVIWLCVSELEWHLSYFTIESRSRVVIEWFNLDPQLV